PVEQAHIIQAVEKTGMHATPWGADVEKKTFFQEHGKVIFTLISLTAIMLGFLLHAYEHSGVVHAFTSGGSGEGHQFPLKTTLLYALAIVFGGWFVF
uniref:hypothetical protein n=1 Tax=Enterococcus faecium TaxID=1352 RepID=UPI0034E9400F